MLKKALLVAVGVASLVLPPLASAEVSYTPASGDFALIILISGQIRREDIHDFLAFARLAREDDAHPAKGSYHVRGQWRRCRNRLGDGADTAA